MMRKKLTEGDKAIISRSVEEANPNLFLNYYLRSDQSGTWWRPVDAEVKALLTIPESIERAKQLEDGYNRLYEVWEGLRRPEFFAPIDNAWHGLKKDDWESLCLSGKRNYRAVYQGAGKPSFHHSHGTMLFGWAEQLPKVKQDVLVIPGGFGSGKTLNYLLLMLWRAACYNDYRGWIIAPYSVQAREGFSLLVQKIQDTPFQKKFVKKITVKDPPKIYLSNEMHGTGESLIEAYAMLDDPGKLLTMTGDEALVDQAERFPNLDTIVQNTTSRFRGMVGGRERFGKLALVANSEDNGQFWDWVDEAETNPKHVWSYTAKTFDNPYLTLRDLLRFESTVAKDEESRRLKLRGERPIGGGKHFNAESLRKCRSLDLDRRLQEGIKAGKPGYELLETPRTGATIFKIAPEPGRRYMVACDPGTDNPPYRDSAVIGAFDITNFPGRPAEMVGFFWIYGNNSPNPWIQKYVEVVREYEAVGFNGFDSTGFQSGYQRIPEIADLMPFPVQLNAQSKYTYLNLTKRLIAEGKYAFPGAVNMLFVQCSNYVLPDDKLRQDIVMMLLIASAQLEQFFYVEEERSDYEKAFPDYDPDWRPFDSDR